MNTQMNRRALLRSLGSLAVFTALGSACSAAEVPASQIGKPPSFWKPLVSAQAFSVLFEEDTERSNTSPLNNEKRKGTFACAACYLPLFTSEMKFNSGTGWPSFFKSLPEAVITTADNSLFMKRTAYHCMRCGGHQGHLFNDGPQPSGRRYCNNGVSLRFVLDGEPLPALRG